MNIAVLGTGMVGVTIANKLVSAGHAVCLGSRTADNPKALAWAAGAGERRVGTFADAAAFGEVVFNCTLGDASIAALTSAGAANLAGKVLLDLSNPLDFSNGMPPSLFVSNTDSLGEQIQRAFPEAKVVKTLNTMNCNLMVDPASLAGDHDVFVCGDDAGARAATAGWLREWFGWRSVVDLGGLSAARGTEAYLLLWVRLWGAVGSANFNLKVVR